MSRPMAIAWPIQIHSITQSVLQLFYRISSPALLSHLGVLAAFSLFAVALGAVAGTGNLLATGLLAGVVVGLSLLAALELVIWIILLGTLLLTGPVGLFQPSLFRLGWAFSILGIFLMVAAIVYAGTQRSARRIHVPAFVSASICFILYCLLVSALSDGTMEETASGIKRYFQYWGLTFALTVVAFKQTTVWSWLRLLVCIALIQLPFALYQFLAIVPIRLNLPMNVVPVDVVAGTFEATMFGGGNSAGMAFFLVLIAIALLALFRDQAIGRMRMFVFLPLVLAPLALGETKIVVALVPIGLLSLYADLIKRRPLAFLSGAIVAGFAVGLLGIAYLGGAANDRDGQTIEQRLQQALDYNVGSVGYFGGTSLNRTSVITYWWAQHGLNAPLTSLVGHGLGSSVSGGIASGHADRKHSGAYIGLTAISALLWDLGLVGLTGYLSILCMAWFKAQRMLAQALPGARRALLRTVQASFLMQAAYLFHSDAIMNFASIQVLQALALGLLAWLANQPKEDL